jgi:hypothetical protein
MTSTDDKESLKTRTDVTPGSRNRSAPLDSGVACQCVSYSDCYVKKPGIFHGHTMTLSLNFITVRQKWAGGAVTCYDTCARVRLVSGITLHDVSTPLALGTVGTGRGNVLRGTELKFNGMTPAWSLNLVPTVLLSFVCGHGSSRIQVTKCNYFSRNCFRFCV